MKLFNQYFFGFLLIAIGIIVVLKYTLNLNIPVGRIIAGAIIIFIGLWVMVGGYHIKDGNDVIFGSGTIKPTQLQPEYNIIFSNGVVDLRDIPYGDIDRTVKIHVVFSDATIKLDADAPVSIKVNAAFASGIMPDNTVVNFGDYTYTTKIGESSDKPLNIEADVVFGSLRIVEN
ncbi:MAG: hypothetical protein ACOYEJ_02240 [Mahellales bacterium]|jgi:hypothetical protein